MTKTPYHAMYRKQVSTWVEAPWSRERLLNELVRLRDMPRKPGWDNRARSAAGVSPGFRYLRFSN